MALNTKINYENINFDSLVNDLQQYLKTKDTFTDVDFKGSHISTLVDLMAYTGSLFSYYINASGNECYIDTAKLYESQNRLSELIGYFPKGFVSSQVNVELVLDFDEILTDSRVEPDGSVTKITSSGYTYEDLIGWFVEIPQWSVFQAKTNTVDGEVIMFTNPKDSTLLIRDIKGINNQNIIIELVQGQKATKVVESNGKAYQRIVIDNPLVDYSQIYVDIDNSVWEQQQSFFDNAGVGSSIYTVRLNVDGLPAIEFGDGTLGKIPEITKDINVTYLQTLGSKGKIGPNQIDKVNTDFYIVNPTNPNDKVEAKFKVIQTSSSTNGGDIESADHIRNYSVKQFRLQGRVVSKQDYSDHFLTAYSNDLIDIKAYNYEDALDIGIISDDGAANYFKDSNLENNNSEWSIGSGISLDSILYTDTDAINTSGMSLFVLNENRQKMAKITTNSGTDDSRTIKQLCSIPTDLSISSPVYTITGKILKKETYSEITPYIAAGWYHQDDLIDGPPYTQISENDDGAVWVSETQPTSGFTHPEITQNDISRCIANDTESISTIITNDYDDSNSLDTNPADIQKYWWKFHATFLADSSDVKNFGITFGADSVYYVKDLKLSRPVETSRYFFNDVFIYTVPVTGQTSSDLLISNIKEDLEKIKMIGVNHVFKNAEYITFNIWITYTKDRKAAFLSDSSLSISLRKAVETFFSKTNNELGKTIRISELITDLQTIEGIANVTVKTETDPDISGSDCTFGDIALSPIQFPVLGSIEIEKV